MRRRTLLLAATGAAVPVAVMESRANSAGPRTTVFPLPHGHAGSVAFSPDGKTLAAGLSGVQGIHSTLRLWDVARGTATTPWPDQVEELTKVAFSPDGKTLATDSDDLTESPVRLWDLRTHTVATTLDAPRRHGFNPVAFASKGTIMATGSADNIVRVWDSGTSYVYAPLTGHTGPVTTVAFSPDGDTLATGSEDRTVRLWDTSSLDVFPLDTLTGHTDKVTTLAFSPDGKTLASGSLDATVRLWPTR
ncbi:WD40 repeat domain-containing protein [Streptomyces canus]|uniref:WD40 repeat domain-containing protein n=1 Tax=Streptomyces canus TaxID=58343 RepID=UPI003865FB82|nr:WD40 repeat domain-containing protein [Streptomyces canus]